MVMAMGAYGGGVASTGRVCGALLGGIAVISRLYSRPDPEGAEDPLMWRLSRKLNQQFEQITAEYGGSNCLDIARVDWKDKEQVKDFRANPHSRRALCAKLVGDTTHALGELLETARTTG